MDVANTVIGVANLGIMYAAVLKFKLDVSYVILVNLIANLGSFGLRELLSSSGGKTNTEYEIILYFVLVILTFAIFLRRFNILESLGIALVVTLITSVIVAFGAIASIVGKLKKRPSREATLDVPIQPRYEIAYPRMQANQTGTFNPHKLV
jgi:ABC-type transport system involved in cytochrome c biogenesis permease subunit